MLVGMYVSYLVFIIYVRVWQLSSHQLKQDDTECVHIRLERIRILLLHSDHFWSLQNKIHSKILEGLDVWVASTLIHV